MSEQTNTTLLITRLAYATARDNWDGYGAPAIRVPKWMRAIAILRDIRKTLDINDPFVCPGSDGSIAMTWVMGDVRITAEIKDKKTLASVRHGREIPEFSFFYSEHDFTIPDGLAQWLKKELVERKNNNE